jgi:proteasome accessory factor B
MAKKPRQKTELTTRRPIERMLRIHEMIKGDRRPNRNVIASELEVSPKTVQRDIDFMRDSLRLPIEYDPLRYGYFYSEPVAQFPTVQITEGELVALFVAEKALSQYRGTPFEKPLHAAFSKLTSSLGDQITFSWSDLEGAVSFRHVGSTTGNLEVFEAVSKAVLRHEELEIDYHKLNAPRPETRRVHPYHLACVENQWYLFAFDLTRKEIRRFVLNRMQSVRAMGRTFTLPDGFSPKSLFGENFGIFSGDQPQEIRIRFRSSAAQLVRERSWHPSQKVTELEKGDLELSFRASSFPEIIRWVLSWGDLARVIEPVMLRDKVAQTARLIDRMYQSEWK